jgi:hypothetical protein
MSRCDSSLDPSLRPAIILPHQVIRACFRRIEAQVAHVGGKGTGRKGKRRRCIRSPDSLEGISDLSISLGSPVQHRTVYLYCSENKEALVCRFIPLSPSRVSSGRLRGISAPCRLSIFCHDSACVTTSCDTSRCSAQSHAVDHWQLDSGRTSLPRVFPKPVTSFYQGRIQCGIWHAWN